MKWFQSLFCVMLFGLLSHVVMARSIEVVLDNQSANFFHFLQVTRGDAHHDQGTLKPGAQYKFMATTLSSAVQLTTDHVSTWIAIAPERGLVRVRNRTCWDTHQRYHIEFDRHIDPVKYVFTIHPCHR